MAVPAPRSRRPSLPSPLLQPFTKQAYAGPPQPHPPRATSASASHPGPVPPEDCASPSDYGPTNLSLPHLVLTSTQTHDPGHSRFRPRPRPRPRRIVDWMRSKFGPASDTPSPSSSHRSSPLHDPEGPHNETWRHNPNLAELRIRGSKPLPHLPSTEPAPQPQASKQAATALSLVHASLPSTSSVMTQVRAEHAHLEEARKEKGRQFERERLVARREARKARPPSPGEDAYGATSYLKRYEGSPRSRGLQLMAQQDRSSQPDRILPLT